MSLYEKSGGKQKQLLQIRVDNFVEKKDCCDFMVEIAEKYLKGEVTKEGLSACRDTMLKSAVGLAPPRKRMRSEGEPSAAAVPAESASAAAPALAAEAASASEAASAAAAPASAAAQTSAAASASEAACPIVHRRIGYRGRR